MKTKKKTIVAIVILVLFLIFAAFIIPKLFDFNRYKGWIASKIEDAVQGEVTIGHITWGISDAIWLKTDVFSITEASTFPVDLNLTNIYIKLAILPLLSKRIEIEELTLDGPGFVLKLNPKTDEIAKEIPRDVLGTLLPVEISVGKLSIQNGRIRIEDGLTLPGQMIIHAFNAVKIEARDIIPGRQIDFHLSLKGESATGLGSLQAKGSLKGLIKTFLIEDPKIQLNVLISSMDTQIFKPYLKEIPLENKLGGLVSLEVKYEGDLLSHFNVEGSVNLSETTYHDPSLGGGETIISYQATVDPHDIRLRDLRITIGNNTVNAKALIKSWNEQPSIKNLRLSSHLFFEELVPIIPWKLLDKYADKIRPIMEKGGQMEIETLTMGEIELTEPLPDSAEFISGLVLTATVSDISIPPMSGMPKLELISGSLELADGIADIEGLQTRVASINLPIISGKIINIVDDPHIQAKLLGALNIPEKLETPVRRLFRKVGIENIIGTADLDLNMEIKKSNPDDFHLEGYANLKDFQLITSYASASVEKLNARVDISPVRIKIADLSTVVVLPKTNETQSGRFSIKLNGRIDDWQKEPVVLVQSLSTSPISLNSVVSVIPWEQIGDKADFVKESFLAGGSLEINNFSLPGINLKKPQKDIKKAISKAKATISISDIRIRYHAAYPLFDVISANVSMDKGVLNISETKSRMGPVTFPSIKLQASGFNDNLQATASIKGPLTVIEADHKAIEKLLREKGFNRITGVTDIDMNFTYFQKQPKDWVANGSLIMNGVTAESYPKGAHLDNLQGKIFFSRTKTAELTLENLSAKINMAPVTLSGKLMGGGTSNMRIDGKADVKGLSLAGLPYLDDLKLKGKLDLDLDFEIPYNIPITARINGTLNAAGLGFHLPDYNLVVKETDINIGFDDGIAQLNKMDITINDQLFHLEGRASDPAAPKIMLLVRSPHLDVDRLLPGDKEVTEPSQQKQKESDIPEAESRLEEKALKQTFPSWAKNMTTDLRVEIDKGKYHGQPFDEFNLAAHYEKGNLKNYGVNLHLANGKIVTTGSVDLRDPERISFVMMPDISNVQIGELSSFFKVEKMPLEGPLSINGHLKGEAGGIQDILSSLDGTLRVDVGSGRIPEVKYLGKLVTELLSFINLKNLFPGALSNKIQNEGIPFRAIQSESTFSNGIMNLNNFIFLSDLLNGNSQGVINFLDEKIALQVLLEPIQTINRVLDWVPVLGKHVQKLTNVYLVVEGPLNDPDIRTIYHKGFTGAIEGVLGIPGAIFKDPEALSGEIDAYMKEGAGEKNTK